MAFPQWAQYAKQHIKVDITMSDSKEASDTEFCIKN